MTETQVWLAQTVYERLKAELMEPLRQRTDGLSGHAAEQFVGDSADQNTDQQLLTARRERENRIRKLQELLQNSLVGQDRRMKGWPSREWCGPSDTRTTRKPRRSYLPTPRRAPTRQT